MPLEELQRIIQTLNDAGVEGPRLGYRRGERCAHPRQGGARQIERLLELPPAALEKLARSLAIVRREYDLHFYGAQPCPLCQFLHRLTEAGDREPLAATPAARSPASPQR